MTRKQDSTRSGFGLRSAFVKCAGMMVVATIVVAAVMAYQSERLSARLASQGVVDLAVKTADVKAKALVAPLRFNALPKLAEAVDESFASLGDSAVAALVIGRDAQTLVERGEAPTALALMADMAQDALETGETVFANGGLLVVRPVTLDDGTVLGAFGVAVTDSVARAAIANDVMAIRLWAAGIMCVMIGAVFLLLRRILGRPLGALSEQIERIAAGKYDQKVPMQTRTDELGMIARHLDTLTKALRRSREAEQIRSEQHTAQADVVRHLSEGLDALADGVLTHQLTKEFPEDYETLRRNFNRAVSSLQQAIAAVKSSGESILNGADEIGNASDDLSRRTETQAATLEQSAAALDQLLSMVKSSAEGAREVDASVQNTSQVARQNGSVMQEAVSAMSEIEQSSEQIGEIISVIDDIAFQTNLLALNAGVEAARAGASGKGFAVVATEVRALAQRSSDAAQQIKALIGNSTSQIKNGAHLVQRAGDALTEVVTMVGDISGHVSRIAESASEQAQGLNEINVGINNLDRVTQQNAAMVEEATAAAQMLRTDSSALSELVARFAIEGQSSHTSVSGSWDAFEADELFEAPGGEAQSAA